MGGVWGCEDAGGSRLIREGVVVVCTIMSSSTSISSSQSPSSLPSSLTFDSTFSLSLSGHSEA